MRKKKIYGTNTKAKIRASLKDKLYHFVLAAGSIRGMVVNGTRMINEMRWNHELGILETLVLGHGYLAAALLSGSLKGNDRVKLQIECSGPIKGMIVESNAFGEVRGFLKQVPIPIEEPLENFDLSPFFGAGFLSLTRYLEDAKHPFTGQVMMENGSIAKDLALYHYQSDQTPSAYVLSIKFDQDGKVAGAGGLFLQVLPGAEENLLEALESEISKLPSLGNMVAADSFPEKLLNTYLDEFQPKILGTRGVEFMCHCNRDGIVRMLQMFSEEELKDMAENGPFPLQIRCHNCNTVYEFHQRQLAKILEGH